MVDAGQIVSLHQRATLLWHQNPAAEAVDPACDPAGWLARVALQHHANFDLWHIEDEARAPGATDHDLAEVKRRSDRTNQQRNDLVETLDLALLEWLDANSPMDAAAPLHSETRQVAYACNSAFAAVELPAVAVRNTSVSCPSIPFSAPTAIAPSGV